MLRIIILSLLMVYSSIAQTTIVKGKLLDANNKPSKYALVGIWEEGQPKGKDFVSCDKEGNYKIILTKPMKNVLLFSIPGHNALKIPVINNKDKEFTIDVTLATYKYKTNFDDVGLSGTFNNFNISSPTKMIKQNDGSYKYEINSDKDTIKYQLCNIVTNGRTINAPNSISYEADSTGDYFSILKVKDGKASIVFNPKDLFIKNSKEKISVSGSNYDKKMIEATIKHDEVRADIIAKLQSLVKNNKSTKKFHYDSKNYLINLTEKISTENDKSVKDYLKLIYISFAPFKPVDYDSSKAAKYFETLQPDNYVWELLPYSFSSCYVFFSRDEWKKIQEKFLKNATSDILKSSILMEKLALAKYTSNKEEYVTIRKRLKSEYGYLRQVKQTLKMFPLNSKIEVGAPIPDFEVVSLDNKNEKISKKSMLGKIYMIDFWATWCMPCVGEMKFLHDAYKKFKDKGFEILSLSSDRDAETVSKFRNKKWGMPWKNSLLNGPKGKKILLDFEVFGIPKPILVGADGKILAMQGELRGENLEKTLSKYFK